VFRAAREVQPIAKTGLAALLVLALGLRLGWVLHLPATDDAIDALPDQREYLEVAKSLLDRVEVAMVDPRFAQVVYAYRTPGYPLFVSLGFGDVRTVRVMQAVLDTSTVLAVVLLARRWLSGRLALLAGLVVAVNPFLIYFSGLILTETLFTALLVWGVCLCATKRSRLAWWGGIVLLLASIYVRPSAVALPLTVGLISMALRTQRLQIGRLWPLPVGATLVLLTALALSPWAIRNHWRLGSWVWTSTNSGITQYDGFNPDADGSSDQSFVQRMPQLRRMGEVERNEYLGNEASKWIAQHPREAGRLALVKAGRTWSPWPLSEQFGSNRLYVLAAASYATPLFVLAMVGVLGGPVAKGARTLLLAPAVYLTVVHMASVGSLRYRVPAEPLLAVLAAAGVATVMEKRKEPQMNADERR
jgi:4-amino-4-deoxy-L-arabinose transferase-like glycosyltransferase